MSEQSPASPEPSDSSRTRKLAAVAVAVMVVVSFLAGQRHDRKPGLEPPF
jgi:hypothetical protein